MNAIAEKYMNLAIDLSKKGKTGLECEYCGTTAIEKNAHGSFCKGCSHPRQKPRGYCFGVPVYDLKDWFIVEFYT
jgi:hypothetical protein